jgi:hypothetical protein
LQLLSRLLRRRGTLVRFLGEQAIDERRERFRTSEFNSRTGWCGSWAIAYSTASVSGAMKGSAPVSRR